MTDCYVLKQAGGVMTPANDETADYLTSVKTDSYLKIKVTRVRNYKFLQKVMVFFRFCYEHWDGCKVHEFCSDTEQLKRFRQDLTILAGFYLSLIHI